MFSSTVPRYTYHIVRVRIYVLLSPPFFCVPLSQALGCTGGGAFKFEESFLQRLGVRMLQMDEMECLVRGMQFALANIPEACYTYRPPVEVKEAVRPPTNDGEKAGAELRGDEPGPDPRDNLRNKRMREMAEVSVKRVSERLSERCCTWS